MRLCLVVLLLASSAVLGRDVEKVATPCETGLCLTWWPKLPALAGWHHERDFSLQYSSNCLAPDGFNFGNAPVVIYARAQYKPRMPTVLSVDAFIADDKKQFLANDPSIVISEIESLTTADGQKLRSFTFTPSKTGNWERVSYGQEGDFFLSFILSARSPEAYRRTQASYTALIAGYRTAPGEHPASPQPSKKQ